MTRTKVQLPNYYAYMGSNESIDERFDDYVHLPVNRSDGSIDYQADHSVRTYTPPVGNLNISSFGQRKMCFIGDSFARYLYFETMRILKNSTSIGPDACASREYHPVRPLIKYPHIYLKSWYGEIFEDERSALQECSVVVLTFARWSATTRHGPLTTAPMFQNATLTALKTIESISPPTTKTFVLSVQPSPIGFVILDCIRYGVLPLMAAYNKMLLDETEMTNSSLRAFKNLTRSFFLDVNDILDPLWDDMKDWGHPCRHGFRLVARRILLLVTKGLAGNDDLDLER